MEYCRRQPDSVSRTEPDSASEMEIFVRSDLNRHYVLLADGDNIVEDVLVAINCARSPEWRLYFNYSELENHKTLADCGIQPGSVLLLMRALRVPRHADDPTKISKTGGAESGSPVRPNGDGEMKIFVPSKDEGNYALEVDSSNAMRVTIKPRLQATTYPLHQTCTCEREMPKVISERKKIIITDRPLAIWEKENDKLLLGLLVENIRNVGRQILEFGHDSWHDTVAKFNEATGLKFEEKHLYERLDLYRLEYQIVNSIRHHPKFSWDHQRQVVIATDGEWNEFIKALPAARPYRRRAVPYIDLLEIVFAAKEESEIVVSNE